MKTTHPLAIVCFTAGIALGAAPAAAGEMCKVNILSSVDTQSDKYGGMLVPAYFGGPAKYLVLDTGGAAHMLKRGVVEGFNLPLHTSSDIEFIDALGAVSHTYVRVPQVRVGHLTWDGLDFAVLNDNGLAGGADVSGVLVPGLLREYDIDMDFVGRKLRLISQIHCSGNVVYWPHDAVAVVPVEFDHDFHIILPVQVDGHRLTAMLDTGSSRTIMYTRAAEQLGVKSAADDAGSGTLGDAPNAHTYEHRFTSLAIEGISVRNPTVTVVPDLHHGSEPTGWLGVLARATSNDRRPDMLIGMSILRHLRVYIAYKEKRLYITSGLPPMAETTVSAPALAPRRPVQVQPPDANPPPLPR